MRGNARGAKGRRKVDADWTDTRTPTGRCVLGTMQTGETSSRTGCLVQPHVDGLPVEVRGGVPPLPIMGCSPSRSLCVGLSTLVEVRPPTGEPCAGEPHARFGGGRARVATGPSYPY